MNQYKKVQYSYNGRGGLFSPLLIGLTSQGKEVMFGYSNTRGTFMMLPLRNLTTKPTTLSYSPRALKYNSGERGKIIKHVYAKPPKKPLTQDDKTNRQKGLQQAKTKRQKLISGFNKFAKLFK